VHGGVDCGVEQFAAALAASHLAGAVAIYRRPLLDGFHVPDAPESERWVDDERARLFRECEGAIERLAKTAEREGHSDETAEWWGRAVSLDRYNSRFVARRIVALARGRPAGAACALASTSSASIFPIAFTLFFAARRHGCELIDES
jgi:hypothetical protein